LISNTHLSFWQQIRRRWLLVEGAPNTSELERVLRGLHVASASFRSQSGHPAVLVVDNFTELAKRDVATFERLVKFAKYEADEGNLVVTFVASEGHTPRRLAEMSESSRLGSVVEIGDLSDDQAVQFLVERHLKPEDAKQIVDFTGGRMRLLKLARTDFIDKKKSIDKINLSLRDDAETALRQAKLILPDDRSDMSKRHVKAWKSIINIIDADSGEERLNTFVARIGDAALADELLRSNIFSYHHEGTRVGIQSRPMWKYLSDQIGSSNSPQRAAIEKKLLRDDL